jgi:hypothetical protein
MQKWLFSKKWYKCKWKWEKITGLLLLFYIISTHVCVLWYNMFYIISTHVCVLWYMFYIISTHVCVLWYMFYIISTHVCVLWYIYCFFKCVSIAPLLFLTFIEFFLHFILDLWFSIFFRQSSIPYKDGR